MTARTRKATKTNAAKNTTARKTTAKKTTPPRPALTTENPRPRLSLVKPVPTTPSVDFRKPLTTRRRPFTGPLGVNEQAAGRAALAAASTRLPIPVRTWNGSTAQLADGTLLIHNPGPDRVFTAHIACRHGAIHGWPINNHTDLREARALTHTCETPHTEPDPTEGLDWNKAIRAGVTPLTQPAVKVSRLTEELKRAKKAAADTQSLSRKDIAAGLTARANSDDQPKEHPQP